MYRYSNNYNDCITMYINRSSSLFCYNHDHPHKNQTYLAVLMYPMLLNVSTLKLLSVTL